MLRVCQERGVSEISLDVEKRLLRAVRPGQESRRVLRLAQELVERSDEHRTVRDEPTVEVYGGSLVREVRRGKSRITSTLFARVQID